MPPAGYVVPTSEGVFHRYGIPLRTVKSHAAAQEAWEGKRSDIPVFHVREKPLELIVEAEEKEIRKAYKEDKKKCFHREVHEGGTIRYEGRRPHLSLQERQRRNKQRHHLYWQRWLDQLGNAARASCVATYSSVNFPFTISLFENPNIALHEESARYANCVLAAKEL